MTNRNADAIQGHGGIPPPPSSEPPDHLRSRAGNTVFKSGPLFISSKGIGWTSWKKRWFMLTRTSLVFFRSDPSIIPQKGSEVNLTLGGIDLNNSGSVVIKADKKLLTVLFPDGRDGRAFTLKAETMEDLYEWKDALENALTQAPSAALVMGQNGIFKNDQPEALDGSLEQLKDKLPMKSMVIGRPILLALEDVDGSPTFLEKSLKFLEEHGVKVEGILRQAADVDDVELRVREYEQGKTEFSAEEDPHVIADCVKHVLRELPSSPVPASCCNALLEACKMDRGVRVSAMRTAICETFPEPNRRLLQRILLMMQSVASNKVVNRMSSSAVAACMAPLLLRPLLAGDCELETDFDVGGDGSVQLLQAAAAANHAQAIVITLLEEYDKIFGECTALTPDIYSDSEVSGSEEASDYEESFEGDEHDESSHDSYSTMIEDADHASIGSGSENGNTGDSDSYDQKEKKNLSMESIEYTLDDELEIQKLENAKTDLQSTIAEEAKQNAVLQASLEKRKEVLHARRLALEQDVAGLQEQLQRERDLRRIMEAGLESPQGHIHFSANIDEKTKADIEEIARGESEITNLKQKFDDLGAKINQQREQNNGSGKDQLHLSQQIPIHHKKLGYKRDQDKQETETTNPSHLSQRSARNKDSPVDETCCNNDGKQERQTLPNKHPPQTQQLDKTRNRNSKSAEPLDGSSSVDSLTGKNIASTNCKKPGTRAEGPNSTTSALSKLTTRLNFLKERRTQITNELQNFDKGRSSTKQTHGQEKGNGPEHRQSLENLDKDKTLPLPKTQHSQNQQNNAELGSNPPLQNTENWTIEWDHTNKNQENHKKSDGQSSNRVLDRGRRPDCE